MNRQERIAQARIKVDEIREELDKLELVTLEVSTRTVDWGSPKSQGKRNGHMVKGGMAAMIRGNTTYHGIDYSEYYISEYDDDFKLIDKDARIFYYCTARDYGLDHFESMVYACTRDKKPST